MITRACKRWTLVGAVAMGIYTLGNMFHPTVVVGQSMFPTLTPGRVIWVDRTFYRNHQPQRGEVIIFNEGKDAYVKRVYRGPGEKLFYVTSGGDWLGPVREDRVEELRALYARSHSSMQVHEMTIPEDSVFVLGDNYL